MPSRSRWQRLGALAVASALLTSLAVSVPLAASADTAPTAPTPSTVSSDSLPTVQVNGVVWTQIIVGNTVYVGGNFTQAQPAGAADGVGQVGRSAMLAYNLSTGALIAGFKPSFNAQVRTIAASADGSTIYAVGDFSTSGGVSHPHVVALDAATGVPRAGFTAQTNGSALALAVKGSTVYVGGSFSSADGVARTRAAAFDATTGALTGWAPAIGDHAVRAMVVSPDGGKIVLGGSFSSVNGSTSPGQGLAAVDTTTGTTNSTWKVGQLLYNHGDNAAIYSLWSDGTNVYGTGYVFGKITDGNLEGTFNASWADGAINWIEDCHGDSYSVATLGDTVYSVSHAHYCGNVPGGFAQTDPNPNAAKKQHALAFTKAATGTLKHDTYGNPYADFGGQPAPSLLTWYPDVTAGTFTGQSQAAWSVTAGSGYVLLGGEFPTVNGVRQTGLARFAVRSVAPNIDGPRLAGSAWTPSAVSLASGSVRVSWPANWDRDNANLTYTVTRNGVAAPVFTTTAESEGFWLRPQLGFVDTGLTPGATVSYRIKATDPLGNTASSATVTATVSSAASASTYAKQVIADGALDYWRLGEAGGAAVYDWAGYNDLTGGAGLTRGATGAVIGDGDAATTFSGDATGVAVASGLVPGPQTFSVGAWFRTTSTAGGKIVGFGNAASGDSSSYDRHLYLDAAGRVNFGVDPGSPAVLQSGTGYNDGKWHQVVGTVGSGGMQLFLDGRRIGDRTDVTGAQAYDGYWRVGGDSTWADGKYFAGDIDDVAVYGIALAPATVKNQWNLSGHGATVAAPSDAYGRAVFTGAPDSYWRLGDAAGTTTVADRTGNGTTATANGGVTFGAAGGVHGTTDTAATFDGATGLVVSNQAVVDPETYSLELSFRTTSTSGGTLIGFGDAATGESSNYDRHVWMHDDGTLEFGTWTGQANTVHTAESYNDGRWHHLVATQGPDGLNLYVDGVSAGTNPATHAQPYSGYWRIGGDHTWGGSSSDYFAGTLDDVAIYSSVLSAGQVANHAALAGGGTANTPPKAAFTVKVTDLSAAFDASGSTDADGTVTSDAWDFGDGATGTGTAPTHTYAKAGTYTVTLTVTDDGGATGTATGTVTAAAPAANVPPTAAFTASASGLGVAVDASASSDPDGTVASYAWTFGDGGTATGVTASHTYAASGTNTVRLTVTDDRGATTSTSKDVTVVAANTPPTASFTTKVADLGVSVDGTASTDADGTVASWAWDFGDGTASATGGTQSHTYAAAGSYTVKLTVTDNGGATNSASKSVTVSAAAPPPPATHLAADSFGRSVTGGLGSATTGGAWSVSGGAANFSVASGAGVLSTGKATTLSGTLSSVSSSSSDVTATVAVPALPVGGSLYAGLVGRRIGTDDYNARVVVAADGTAVVQVLHGGTALKSAAFSGGTIAAGTVIHVRMRTTGTGTTTLQARAWLDGTTEPTTWQATATDTTAALQAAGSVGIRTYLGGGVTNGPLAVKVDDFLADPVP